MSSTNDRLKKAENTSKIAFGIINAEADAREAKSAKLRKLREALDEGGESPNAAARPVAKKMRAAARGARKVGP